MRLPLKLLRSAASQARRLTIALLGMAILCGILAWFTVIVTVPPPGNLLAPWSDLAVAVRMNIATSIVAVLSVSAAVLAIAAGLAEVRELFPTQRIEVRAHQKENQRLGVYRTISINCPTGSALINAWRVEIELVDKETRELLAAPEEPADTFIMSLGSLGVPSKPPFWRQTYVTEDGGYHREGYYRWVHEDSEPFFPGLSFEGPAVDGTMTRPAIWIVIWWTDRTGPVTVTLPFEQSA